MLLRNSDQLQFERKLSNGRQPLLAKRDANWVQILASMLMPPLPLPSSPFPALICMDMEPGGPMGREGTFRLSLYFQ